MADEGRKKKAERDGHTGERRQFTFPKLIQLVCDIHTVAQPLEGLIFEEVRHRGNAALARSGEGVAMPSPRKGEGVDVEGGVRINPSPPHEARALRILVYFIA